MLTLWESFISTFPLAFPIGNTDTQMNLDGYLSHTKFTHKTKRSIFVCFLLSWHTTQNNQTVFSCGLSNSSTEKQGFCPNLTMSQTLKKSQNYLRKKQEKLKNSTRTKKCPDKEKSKRNWDDSTIFYLYVNSCFSNLDSRVFLRILILLYLNITATSVYRLFFPVVNKWIAAQLPTSDSSI